MKFNLRLTMRITGLILFSAACAVAQNGSFGTPIAGYVLDRSTSSLRPVLGIPGAATLGAPIQSDYSWNAAYVAPKGDSFIGVAIDGSTHWFVMSGGAFAEKTVAGIMTLPARVVYSPNGTAAALYGSGQAQIVTGLPGAPSIAATIQIKAPSEAGQRHIAPLLAVSDDGQYLLAAGNGSIQLANANGSVRTVMPAGSAAAVAFAPGTHDAAIAARGTGALLIRDIDGSAIQQLLAPDGQAFNAVAGIAFSTDGSHVFYASASAKSVSVFDLAGGRNDIACSCAPSQLTAMGAAFRLTELTKDPLWLLDASASGPRVVFVPALTAAQ